jgi:hypothetical protein
VADAAILRKIDRRRATVVELLVFGGLSMEEAGDLLALSPQSVRRDWKFAKAWLLRDLGYCCFLLLQATLLSGSITVGGTVSPGPVSICGSSHRSLGSGLSVRKYWRNGTGIPFIDRPGLDHK